MKFQDIFTGDEARVSVSVPEPDGGHLFLLECWLEEEWFPLGVLRDADVLPTMRLLAKAYDSIRPGKVSWMQVE